ncbi:MAG: transcriptional regulator [Bacteroidales bacterium]
MLNKLNPLLHSELRLGIMSILVGIESSDFTYIKKETQATSGNISVQLDKLVKANYITITKTFKGRKPCTTCAITKEGHQAFMKYFETLKTYFPE